MILVSGATGTIGKEVVKQLSQAGAKVRALTRDPSKANGLKGPNVEVVQGDLADPKSLERAFSGVEKAFLLTDAGPKQVELQHNFIEAAKKAKVKHLVKLSVMGANTNSPVTLGKWHGQTEEELKKSGLGWTILQPGSFMQNTLTSAATIKSQSAFFAPAKPDAKVAFIDTRDIALVAARTLLDDGHAGKTYMLTGGEAITHEDMARALSENVGKQVKFQQVPPDQFKKTVLGFGMPAWLADDLNQLYAFYNTGAAAQVSDVVQKVGKAKPRTFAQFAQDHAGAFK